MSVCIGINTVAATLATAIIGEVTPEPVKTYVSVNTDPWDNNNQFNFKAVSYTHLTLPTTPYV